MQQPSQHPHRRSAPHHQQNTKRPGNQDEPDPDRQASRMDQLAEQLRQISARLDEADMRKAQQAREKAAEITSLQPRPERPRQRPIRRLAGRLPNPHARNGPP